MIKEVLLENWKSHGSSSLEFEKGTNVIVGQSGSGKSSVMDAICFCLFGTFPALNSKRVSIEEVIMAKPNRMEAARLRMSFTYNNNEYVVERIVKRRGTNEAVLYCNNRLVAGPKSTDVNESIERELEISYDLFSRAVYSEQNQIDFFLRLSPSQRKEKFDELLGLDRYEKARSNAVSAANRMKSILEDKKKWLNEIKDQAREQELPELIQKAGEREKRSRELEENHMAWEKEIEKNRKETTELLKKEKDYKAFHELLIKTIARIEENRMQAEETAKELGNRKEGEVGKEAAELGGKISEAVKKTLPEKEITIEHTQKKLNKTVQEIIVNESKIKELEKNLLELGGIEGKCPVCRQELGEKTKKELLSHSSNEKRLILEKNLVLEKEKKEIEKLLEKENLEKKRTEKEIEKNREKLVACEQLLLETRKTIEKQRLVRNLEAEAGKLERLIEELAFDEKQLEEKRKKEIELQGWIESAKKEAKGIKDYLEEIRKRISIMEETKKQRLELEKDINAVEKGFESTSIFISALKATQAELRGTLVETINEAMQDIWPKIYPYEDFSSAKMVVEEGSYELKVKQRNREWVRVEGILSGGERSAAALCIRIAFSLVLTQNLSWIILDEPTHNLDSRTVSELNKILREYMPELVEQIFVITHDKELEKAATATIFVLHREKNEDGITRPEQITVRE